jgi:spore coat protein CotH
VTIKNAGIRSRGNGSRRENKPGLRFDADRYSAEQTFLGMKSFVLDNLVQDASMIKERIAMLFFRRMGLPAPRETHVRLFINDEFVGLYAAVESIDKTFLGRTFGADDHGGTQNDGFLFEYDYLGEYRFEHRGEDLTQYAMFKPQTREKDAAAEIWGPIESMIQAINETPDNQFVSTVSTYLDLNMFARYTGIENFLAEWDGLLGAAGMNNFYFYRFEDRTQSQWLAWDKDNTFRATDYPILQGIGENVLARRALAFPSLMNGYLDTLIESAASAAEPDAETVEEFSEEGLPVARPGWLEREVLREYTQIRDIALADPVKAYTNEEFEAEIQRLMAFARERSTFVRTEVEKLRGQQ